MLDLRSIAVQGIGYGPLATAVQGFNVLVEDAVVIEGGAVLKATVWDSVHKTKAQLLHHQRLIEEDKIATEFILALMTTGFLDG